METKSAPVRVSEGWLAAARRRGVLRVAASYAVIAWLLIQIADTTFERLGLPDWLVTAVIVTALLGLPVALALAWFFEFTSHGIERESAAAASGAAAVVGVRRYADIIIIAMLVIVVAVLLTRQPDSARRGMGKEASIAVLPFQNLSGDPQQEYFSDGVAEEILGRLAVVEGLRVAARTSSFALKGKGLDASTIAERLGVHSLLEGSVRRSGQELRLTASLIDGKSGHVLWSKSFTRRAADVFAVQDEVAQAVIAEVLPAQGMGTATFKAPTSNLSAHDYYLLALALRWRRDEESRNRTVQHLEQAIALDPQYALAHAALARAVILRDFSSSVIPANEPAAIRAEMEARTALALNDSLPSAHGALATVLWRTGREGAPEEYARALKLAPNDAVTLHEYSIMLAHRGESGPGKIALLARILEIDPFALVTRVNFLDAIRRTGDAKRYRAELARTFELYGDDARALDGIALHWRTTGEFAEVYRIGRMQMALGEDALGMSNIVEATYFSDLARCAELLDEARRRRLASGMPRTFDMSTQLRLRRWEPWSQAVQAYRAANPDDRTVHHHIAFALLLQDRIADAARESALGGPMVEFSPAGIGGSLLTYGFPAAIMVYRRSGQEDKARALIDEHLPAMLVSADKAPLLAPWPLIAAVESLEGRKEGAVHALQKALEYSTLPRFMPELPWFAQLEGTPGYSAFLTEYEVRRARMAAEFDRIDAEFAARKP